MKRKTIHKPITRNKGCHLTLLFGIMVSFLCSDHCHKCSLLCRLLTLLQFLMSPELLCASGLSHVLFPWPGMLFPPSEQLVPISSFVSLLLKVDHLGLRSAMGFHSSSSLFLHILSQLSLYVCLCDY